MLRSGCNRGNSLFPRGESEARKADCQLGAYRIFAQGTEKSGGFLYPGLLDGFEYFFAAAFCLVVKAWQRQYPVSEINKINLQRILLRMCLSQFDGDYRDVCPFHFPFPPSLVKLMLYFGIAMTRG